MNTYEIITMIVVLFLLGLWFFSERLHDKERIEHLETIDSLQEEVGRLKMQMRMEEQITKLMMKVRIAEVIREERERAE